MSGPMQLKGTLEGHEGDVTSLATTNAKADMLVSGSRDKTVMVWNLTRDPVVYGTPLRSLHGHSHFVQDVIVSNDGRFALSASWDATLRLWDLNTGATTRRFVGHKKEVMSVSFSHDNRQIISGSRDKSVKLWNTLGECKFNFEEQGHTEWVSCVRFSPNPLTPIAASGGWDRMVKVWSMQNFKLKTNLVGHTGYVNTVALSPDCSLCASGGKDGTAMLWDLNEGKLLYSLNAGSIINHMVFSPNKYWLCAATDSEVLIWDLESRTEIARLNNRTTEGFKPRSPNKDAKKIKDPACLSLAWSADGVNLFAGYSDRVIRVFSTESSAR